MLNWTSQKKHQMPKYSEECLRALPPHSIWYRIHSIWFSVPSPTYVLVHIYILQPLLHAHYSLTHPRTGFIFRRIKSLFHHSNWQHIFLISFNGTSKRGVMHYNKKKKKIIWFFGQTLPICMRNSGISIIKSIANLKISWSFFILWTLCVDGLNNGLRIDIVLTVCDI